ncbi:MAG: hypothetical protein AAFN70_05035, partial [Planctomycetota bacterium]
MEILEDRRMLAAILFHNEGGSALWHDVGNWDLGRLPTDGDDVSIPANIGTVTFDGPDATVDSINALSPLSIQSGLLKSEETLALAAGSSLTVDGPQSVFQSAGPATIDSVNLIVQSGGTIAIADVDSFQQTTAGNVQLRSDGAGSVLSLPGLKTLEGANAYHHNLLVTATEGGEIQLPAMTSQSGAVYFSSTGTDSKIDVPSLESFRGYINGTSSGFHVADNGEIDATSLTSITTGGLHLGTDGIFPTEQLEFFDGGFWGSLRIDQTARDFSSLSTLRHGTLDVNVPGQDFDAITTLEYLTILADVENASVTINNTENYVGGLYGNAQRWDAVAPGSSISMPDLQSIEIQNIWRGTNSVNVNEGGVVSLPNLITQSGPSYFSSTGADSKIDVSSLESFRGYINGTSSGFHVADNGEIDASSLTSITAGGLHLGSDGIFPTEQLEFFDGGFWGSLRIDQTARDFSSLSTLRHGTLDVNVPGQDFDAITTLEYLTILADVENASVTINNTENYVGGLYGNAQRWDAVAPGSSISMPDLQSIEIQNIWRGTNSVNVNEGGVVSLPNLITQSGPSYFSSTGADSKIDVSSLESFRGYINGTSSGFHV